MEQLRFVFIGLMLIPLIPILWGLVCIFKKDWAWRAEGLWYPGVTRQRSLRWQKVMTFYGVALIVIGVGLGLFMVFRLLPLLPAP